jgi:hypothetical protein
MLLFSLKGGTAMSELLPWVKVLTVAVSLTTIGVGWIGWKLHRIIPLLKNLKVK